MIDKRDIINTEVITHDRYPQNTYSVKINVWPNAQEFFLCRIFHDLDHALLAAEQVRKHGTN